MRTVLKKDIKKLINKDPFLYATVAVALKVSSASVAVLLNADRRTVTQYPVLKSISEYLKIPIDDLVETVPDKDLQATE